MTRFPRPSTQTSPEPVHTTMLDLVVSLGDSGLREADVVATATDLIRSGHAVLTGNFANTPPQSF